MKTLNDYIIWYNQKRIKISLGNMSPLEYRQSLGLKVSLVQEKVRTPNPKNTVVYVKMLVAGHNNTSCFVAFTNSAFSRFIECMNLFSNVVAILHIQQIFSHA